MTQSFSTAGANEGSPRFVCVAISEFMYSKLSASRRTDLQFFPNFVNIVISVIINRIKG